MPLQTTGKHFADLQHFYREIMAQEIILEESSLSRNTSKARV